MTIREIAILLRKIEKRSESIVEDDYAAYCMWCGSCTMEVGPPFHYEGCMVYDIREASNALEDMIFDDL